MISICIPAYEMGGLGEVFLKESFEKINQQTLRNFEVVVSDQSENNEIAELCEHYAQYFAVKYIQAKHLYRSSSVNLNNALRHATGDIIKVLFQDDLFVDGKALELIWSAFEESERQWLVHGCMHTSNGKDMFRRFEPRYHPAIYLGKNTISSPSVLAFRKHDHLWFDEKLIWLMDVDYYKRCHDAHGPSITLIRPLVANRTHANQVSQNVNIDIILREVRLVRKKFIASETFELRIQYYKEIYKLLSKQLKLRFDKKIITSFD